MQRERDRPYHKPDQQDKEPFRVPECIPVFPLPNVVFFPRTYLPLHIFELRYREMVADAAAEGRCIGMVLLKEGWEDDYYGNPPIFQIGCVGRLVSMQQLPDGRSNIMLQGLERYVIRQEIGGKRYRRAKIATVPREPSAGLEGALRAELTRVFKESLDSHEALSVWRRLAPLDANDDLLVNVLSTSLDFTPLEKQFLLEAESLHQQARRLYDLIQFRRHDPGSARGQG